MSLNLKSPEAEALAREVATMTGETMTGAITTALRERLERLQAADDAAAALRTRRLIAISCDAARRWKEPYASTSHGELLYDELGRPW